MDDISDLNIIDFEVKEDTLSLYKAVKDDLKDKIEVEIGDSKDLTVFQPQAKIMRWDNEVNLSVRYKDSDTSQLVADSKEDVVEWVKSDKEVHIYEKPEVAEDGGLEIEVVIKEKPISNIVEFSIETKGLDFFYQPELTQEEIDNGADRPENVVGSYAVYYKDSPANIVGGKEYKAGKLCHIFRPEVIDAKGNKIWGVLNVDTDSGLLTITIDEKWLEKAVYPVIVDPTFGYTTQGGGATAGWYNTIYGGLFTSDATAGTLASISVCIGGMLGEGNFKGIVTNSSKNIITNGITASAYLSTSHSFQTASFSVAPSISSSTNYYLAVVTDVRAYISLDITGGTSLLDGTNSYASPVDPTDATGGNYLYSIYATYTEASGTEASSTRSLYTKGKTASSSNRDIYSVGSVTGSSTRLIRTAGYYPELYWVGGTGNWNDSTNHWATSSGGTPNALHIPTKLTNVHFDANSGFGSGGTVSVTQNTDSCKDITCTTGHTFTIATSTNWLNIYGSATYESGLTVTGELDYVGPNSGKTITQNGATLGVDVWVYCDPASGTGSWALQDDFEITGTAYFYDGTFDANDQNVIAGNFYSYANNSYGYNPTIVMGSGTWEVAGAYWEVEEVGGTVTITPETSTIKVTGHDSQGMVFEGENKTYNNIWYVGTGDGSGGMYVYDSNTFNDFKITGSPTAVSFDDETITTVSSFTATGTVGNLITLDSIDSVSQFHLSKSSGIVVCDYLDISNSSTIFLDTCDSYTGSYNDDYFFLAPNASLSMSASQSFTGNGEVLNSCKFYLFKNGSPTGNAYAKIYAHTGTFGTSSVPTGSALATSDAFDVSSLTLFPEITTFTFSGANKITLSDETNYVLVVTYDGGTGSDYLKVAVDDTSPSHNGNPAYSDENGTNWTASPSADLCFYIYTDASGATWYAGSHSVDTDNNDGWIFDSPTGSSERDIYSSGKVLSSSERSVYTRGSATSSREVELYTQGSSSNSSERGVYTEGGSAAVEADSERLLHTVGKVAASSTRGLYTEGFNSGSSERGVYSISDNTTSSTRNLYTEGFLTSSSERGLYTEGVASTSSERGTYSIGDLVADSEKSIYTIGKQSSSSTRGIYTTTTAEDGYSWEVAADLETDDSSLSNSFSEQNYTDVATDDDVYVCATGDSTYLKFLFKVFNSNLSNEIFGVTWKGKAAVAPSGSVVTLQIYNRNSSEWEILDTNNTTASGVEFTLSGSVITNPEYYYDENYITSCRVYQ